jgi:RNase H-fold protein (predicted Holliday junction resolvase)
MARVKNDEPRFSDENDLIARTKKYAFLKSQLDYFEKEQKALRALLFENLDEIGEEDDKGNVVIELPEEVEGYSSVVKQRRVSRKIDEALAEEIITKHGLEDVLYKTIRVVDEDALMAALYEDVLTEEEVDDMYPQSITWALVLKK